MGSPVVIASPRKSPSSGRRTNKPLVEKKRRARINGCLGQLKSLILNAVQTEGAQVSRLEKADILEMTVKYLRHIQRQQVSVTVTSEPEVMAKFSAGYTECATEVIRYMDTVQCVTPEIRSRLESHLVERLRGSVPGSNTVEPISEGPSPLSQTSALSQAPTSVPTSVFSSQISSTTSSAEEISRHYQTAVDLANMAAAVTAKETAASAEVAKLAPSDAAAGRHVYETNMADWAVPGNHRGKEFDNELTRSQSLSPASMHVQSGGESTTAGATTTSSSSKYDTRADIRRRHSSSDASLSSPSSLSSTTSSTQSLSAGDRDMYSESEDNNYRHHHHYHHHYNNSNNTNQVPTVVNNSSNSDRCQSVIENNNTNNNNTYDSALLRPLHIHIPGSSTPPTTPSPPFPHPHVAYLQTQGHHIPVTVAVPITTNSVHGEVDDSPPTILYGVENFPRIPQQSSKAPEMRDEDASRRATPPNNAITDNETTTAATTSTTHYFNGKNYLDNNNNKYNKSYTNKNEGIYNDSCHAKGRNTEITRNDNEGGFHALSPREFPITPSPPTGVVMECYERLIDRQEQLFHHHHPHYQQRLQQQPLRYNNNYLNLNKDERIAYNVCPNGEFITVCSNYEDQYKRQAEYEYDYRCRQIQNNGIELHQQYRQRDSLQTPQQVPCNHPSNGVTPSKDCPVEQIPHTSAPHNNGLTHMNGPSPHPRVLPRQNDTSLSPPTLKRRLLFAQGSEGDRAGTPRCSSDGHLDKRRILAHDDTRLSDGSSRRQNPQVWQVGREAQIGLCREVHRSAFPAAIVCTSRAHAVAADEGLWRPW